MSVSTIFTSQLRSKLTVLDKICQTLFDSKRNKAPSQLLVLNFHGSTQSLSYSSNSQIPLNIVSYAYRCKHDFTVQFGGAQLRIQTPEQIMLEKTLYAGRYAQVQVIQTASLPECLWITSLIELAFCRQLPMTHTALITLTLIKTYEHV